MASKLAKTETAAIAEGAPETSAAAKLPDAFWALPKDLQNEGPGVYELYAAVVNGLLEDTGLEASTLVLMLVERCAHLYVRTRVNEERGIGNGGTTAVDETAGNGFKDERAYKDALQQLNTQAMALQKVGYGGDVSTVKEAVLDKVDDLIEIAVSTLPSDWQGKVRSAIDFQLKQSEF